MKKKYIEGINGSIEITDKYIIVIIGTKEKRLLKEHIVLFEEIENIEYKKPTNDKYGYLSLYLFTNNFLTKEKINYTLILDRIDEKSLDNNKKLYNIIKEIVKNNKDIKIEEIEIEKEIDSAEEDKEVKNNIINEEEKTIEKKQNIDDINNKKIIKNEEIITINEDKIKEKEEINNEEIFVKENKKEILVEEKEKKTLKTYNDFEEDYELELDIEQDIDNKIIEADNEKILEFEKLEKKLIDLEKELLKLSYKERILNKYVDEANDKSKIDKLILEIKKLIEKLNQIKKEILNGEKKINQNDYIKLDNGNVIITSISEKIKRNLPNADSIVDIYIDISKEVQTVEKETEELSSNMESKKNEINITDDEYEHDINLLKNVESTREVITKYRQEALEDLNKIKKKIEKTIESQKKYKFVKRGIEEQTKRLALFTALNSIRPKRSKFSTYALGVATGLFAIHDLLGYDIKEVNYNEVVIKESLIGIENVNTAKVREIINISLDEIDNLLCDCELKYRNYPKYDSLYKSIIGLKNDIEKESEELRKIEDKLNNYKSEEKIKILRYKEE